MIASRSSDPDDWFESVRQRGGRSQDLVARRTWLVTGYHVTPEKGQSVERQTYPTATVRPTTSLSDVLEDALGVGWNGFGIATGGRRGIGVFEQVAGGETGDALVASDDTLGAKFP